MESIKTKDIQEMIAEVQNFKGEYANEYKTRQEYVEYGAFEKDYFASWLESCSDYPCVREIAEMAMHIQEMADEWLLAVEDGVIEPEDGWAEEEPDLYWVPDHAEHKWYLFSHTCGEDDEEAIAEVGVEDGELEGEKSYYWIEIESSCGYGDFDTLEEAKADAEAYFDKH